MTSRVEAVAEILWHRYSPDHEGSWPSPNADEYRRVASDILSALTTEPAAPEGRKAASAASVDPDGLWERAYAETAGVHREIYVMAQSRASHSPEALANTGAVKVKALVNSLLDLRDLIMRGKRCVTDTGPAVKPVIELAAVHILDDAANALEALSALEPAAPESQQDDDRIRREMDEILRKQSERDIPFAPATRPSEQAVTEALKRIRDYADKAHADRYVIRDMAEKALKAAMEAGRHD